MQGKLMFVAGAALGYVLGARAGREQYEAMKSQADTLWHDPRVQQRVDQATTAVKEKAPDIQAKVTGAVKDKAPDIQAKVTGAAAAAKDKVTEKVSGSGDTEVTKANVTTNDHPGHGYPPEGALP